MKTSQEHIAVSGTIDISGFDTAATHPELLLLRDTHAEDTLVDGPVPPPLAFGSVPNAGPLSTGHHRGTESRV